MISRPPGWTALYGVTTQTLIAPEGPEAAGIRYTERVRPLLRLGDIVEDWLGRHHHVAAPVIGAPERLMTYDGEHASVHNAVNSVPQVVPLKWDLSHVSPAAEPAVRATPVAFVGIVLRALHPGAHAPPVPLRLLHCIYLN